MDLASTLLLQSSAAGEALAGASVPMSAFLWCSLILAMGLLVWDTIEVGRNDAANLLNAVLGARVLRRRVAIIFISGGVVMGTLFASPVIETARKGIFDPAGMTLQMALSIYIAVYIVDTVLLYGYSAFGMPVSTTATLVFELLGASLFVGGFDSVHWGKSGTVVLGIVCSIVLSGIAAFMIQRAVRGALRDRATHLPTLLAHGGWVGGAMVAGLVYFMLIKGMKGLAFVKTINQEVISAYGPMLVIFLMWAFFAIVIHALLVIYRQRAANLLFPVLTVIASVCMAFAFGQNDLANCASPGLAAKYIIDHRELGVEAASQIPISRWWLVGCGALLVVGISSRNAQRVTSATIRTGSAGDHVELWAPQWCLGLARGLLRFRGREPALAPVAVTTDRGRITHFDTIRASVIMCVSASVIATASSLSLPVSTTYVSFAALVATGFADRIFQRGDAALKLGRAIWVVFSWFMAAAIAVVGAGLVAMAIHQLAIVGMIICLLINAAIRRLIKRRADRHQKFVSQEAQERLHPEDFATEDA